jgi:hypothetical protein
VRIELELYAVEVSCIFTNGLLQLSLSEQLAAFFGSRLYP